MAMPYHFERNNLDLSLLIWIYVSIFNIIEINLVISYEREKNLLINTTPYLHLNYCQSITTPHF